MSPHRRPHRRPVRLLAAVGLLAVLAAGCSSDGSDDGAAATTATTAATGSTAPEPTTSAPATTGGSATTAGEATSTTSAPAAGCTTPGSGAPAGAVSKQVDDLDGDGRPDVVWIADAQGDGQVSVGVTTAAGGSTAVAFDSASPVRRSVLVADADEQGPVELFFDDGRSVGLHAFVDCTIVPVEDQEGAPYTFSLGFTDHGTGVGCIDTPDGRRLAGLDRGEQVGSTVPWTSTVVDLDGTVATNGAEAEGSYTVPADDAEIALLSTVTCGDRTVDADGVSLPQ